MSTESASIRRQKRIVEHIISGFKSAEQAIAFGNTVEMIINENIEHVKFKLGIKSPETWLNITSDWKGETILKMSFLELMGQDLAIAICNEVKKIIALYESEHPEIKLNIDGEIVRGKPAPQFMRQVEK